MPNVRITADLLNNSVLIYARPDEYKLIERTLIQLDRPKLQVAIDVTIAEVTLNDQLNYGVQFFLSGGAISNTVSGTMPSIINNVASNNGSTTTGTGLSGGLNIIAGNPASPRVVINALSAITDVKILSNPSLVVVDNGDASLEVGDQVPISTGSATVLSANNAVVNTVDYKNTGVILHVQPHVNYNGSVMLDIDQLVSEPTGSSSHPHDFDARGEKHDLSHFWSNGPARRHDPATSRRNRGGACRFSIRSRMWALLSARRARARFAPSSSCSFDRKSFGTAPTPRWSLRSFAQRCEAEKTRRLLCPICSTSSPDPPRSDSRAAREFSHHRLTRSGAVDAVLIGAVGAGAVWASVAAAPGWSGAAGATLAGLMLAIAVVDHRRMIIPDELSALAFIAGLVAVGVGAEAAPAIAILHALVRASLMFALFFGFRAGYRALRGLDGMGLGDVKLAAVAGVWLDWAFLPVVVEIAALSALAAALYARFRGDGFDPKARLPFGAFFAPAIWICWLLIAWRSDWAPP